MIQWNMVIAITNMTTLLSKITKTTKQTSNEIASGNNITQ